MAEKTVPKQFEPYAFKPGESGNPSGRPKGSRNKLAQKYTDDLLSEWERRGMEALKELSAVDLVRATGAILPKEHNVRVGELDELTDDQLERRIGALIAQLALAGVGGSTPDEGQTAKAESSGELPTIQ